MGESRGKRLPKAFTDEELTDFFNEIRHSTDTGLRDRTMFELMLGCGLRTSEVIAVKRADIDWTVGVVNVVRGKGAKDRAVPIPARTLDWMRRWDEKRARCSSFLHSTKGTVRNKRGTPLSADAVQAQFRKYRERAGLRSNLTPHSLRHTLATQRLRQHFDLREVQELLGHSNVATTQVYTHVSQAQLIEKTRRLDEQQSMDRAPSAEAVALGSLLEQAGVTREQLLALLPEQ